MHFLANLQHGTVSATPAHPVLPYSTLTFLPKTLECNQKDAYSKTGVAAINIPNQKHQA
jgi:hypothetical protein